MSGKTKNKVRWYESGNVIISLIIVVILIAIFCSQSFVTMGSSSFSIFTSIINHNSIYFLVLIYFVLLLTKAGKKYFNYLNVFLIFIYFISSITSFLTMVQSFSLNTVLSFSENLVLLVYLFHTMLRDTRVWKDMKLGYSPFNEVKNDTYYYLLIVLVVLTLVINLISTVVVSGLLISILDALYVLLFGRYIYLYRDYLDYHKLDSNNKGNFDEIKESITSDLEGVKEKINDALDKTDMDEKIVDAYEKVLDATKDLLDKTDVDEKIVDTANKAKNSVKDLFDKKENKKETLSKEKEKNVKNSKERKENK